MDKAICLISGGLDSAVAAAWARPRHDLLALHVDYRQRAAARERRAAEAVARSLGALEFRCVEVPYLGALGASALTDPSIAIPRGRISEGEIPVTQVPFRNGLFLALACAWAEAAGASVVVIGAVEEDSSGYPDCRESFLRAFERAARLGTRPGCDIRVAAPLVHRTKGEIVKLGADLGAPFELTWSCYEGGEAPCATCESCLLRARGFSAAGMQDPLTS